MIYSKDHVVMTAIIDCVAVVYSLNASKVASILNVLVAILTALVLSDRSVACFAYFNIGTNRGYNQ